MSLGFFGWLARVENQNRPAFRARDISKILTCAIAVVVA